MAWILHAHRICPISGKCLHRLRRTAVDSFPSQYHFYRIQNNLYIAKKRNILHIPYVIFKLLGPAKPVPPRHLSKSSQPRPYVMPVLLPAIIAFQIFDDVSEYIAGEKSDGTTVLDYLDLDKAKALLNTYLNAALAELDGEYNGDTAYLREFAEKFVIV